MAGDAVIVAGFGFRASATTASLRDAYDRAGGQAAALATAEDKAHTPVFAELSAELGLPILAIPPDSLSAQTTTTQSAASIAARATGSVAEAAALAGAEPGARLITARVVSHDGLATCALAEGGDL